MSNIWKRSLSMFLAIVMVLGNVPMQVFATETEHNHEDVTAAEDAVLVTEAAVTEPVVAVTEAVAAVTEPTVTEPVTEAPETTAATENESVVESTAAAETEPVVETTVAAETESVVETTVPVEETEVPATEEILLDEALVSDPKGSQAQRQIPEDWTAEMKEIQALIDEYIEYYLGYYEFQMPDETKFAPIIQAQIEAEDEEDLEAKLAELPEELVAEWEEICDQIEDIIVNSMDDNERENARAAVEEVDGLMMYYMEEGLLTEKQCEAIVEANPVFVEFADLASIYGVDVNVLATSDYNFANGKINIKSSGSASADKCTAHTDNSATYGVKGGSVFTGGGSTNEITIKNISGVRGTISFNYSMSNVNSATGFPNNGSGTYSSGEIENNATATLSIKGNTGLGSTDDGSVSLTNITFTPATRTITFGTVAQGGTYTVNGGTPPTGTVTVDYGTVYTLVATPDTANEYSFAGWFVSGKDTAVSTALEYPLTLTENTTITPRFTLPEVTLEFAAADVGGTYTVNGNAPSTLTEESGKTYLLAAQPAAGYALYGWYDVTNSEFLSFVDNYTLTSSGDMTVKPVFVETAGAALFRVGDQNFYSLNAADAAAKAAGGATIILLNNGTLQAVEEEYTISAGNTLLIPMADGKVYTTAPRKAANPNDSWSGADVKETYITPSAYRTLTMAAGTNITVDGAISIAGSQFAGGRPVGGVHGPVGFIQMAAGSKITVNNGAKLYAWGYVTGSGEVEVLSGGTVYESFQVMDWRGGNATSQFLNNSSKVFPLSQYYVQNVEVPMKLHKGAIEQGYTSLTATKMTVGTPVPFVGSNSLFTIDSGYLLKDYDEATDRQTYKIYGDVSMRKIVITLEGVGTMDSSKYVLPITNNLTVDVVSGIIDITQDLAFLPGSEIIVRKGARCDLADGKSMYVYDLNEWVTATNAAKKGYVAPEGVDMIALVYAPGKTGTRAALSDAKIQIDGTINADAGFLYTTAGGASVTSNGTGVVKMKAGEATETYQATQTSSNTPEYWPVPVQVAKLQNADGKTPATTDPSKINPDLGVVYTYTDGVWVADCPGDDTCTFSEEQFACKAKECIYCDYVEAGDLAPHTPDEANPATCTTGQNCSVCGDPVADPLGHKAANGQFALTPTAEKASTCYEAGHKAYYQCTLCNAYFADNNCETSIADLTAWLAENGDGYIAKTDHSWGSAVQTKAPTCTEMGINKYTCTVTKCGASEERTEIAALGHKADKGADCKAADCTNDGIADYWYCKNCKLYYLDAACSADKLIGNADALDTWKSGDGKIEKLGHAPEKTDEVASTCTVNGTKAYWYCDKCKTYYSDEACTAEIGDAADLTAWLKGDGQLTLADHDWEDVKEEKNSCSAPGHSAYKDCKNCDAVEGKVVYEQLKHEGIEQEDKAATCTEDGWKVYYQCKNGCNEYYSDEACSEGNKIGDEAALKAWKSGDGKIAALGHHLVLVPEVPKTCTVAGTKAYYQCKAEGDRTVACGAAFEDEAGETPINDLNTWKVIPAAHTPAEGVIENKDETTGIYELVVYCAVETCKAEISRTLVVPGESNEHKLKLLDRVEPTCYSTGLTAGAICEAGKENIENCAACSAAGAVYHLEQKVIEKLPHTVNTGNVTVTWNEDNTQCTVTTTCAIEACKADITETVAATKTAETAATCEAAGSATYTAGALTDAAFTKVGYTIKDKVVELPKLEHQYGEVKYEWSTDNSTCTATQTCALNTSDSCVRTEVVKNIEGQVTAPTCTADGYITYMADFVQSWAVDQTKTEVGDPATGHTWKVEGAPVWNLTGEKKTCTVDLKCECAETAEVTLEVAEKVILKDTCEQAGEILYTAAFKAEGNFAGDKMPDALTKTENPDVVQHNWSKPTYSWDGYTQCTATRTCGVDATHVETETVTATAGENSATCTAGGKIVHTSAAFENVAFAVQTKDETTQALGHAVEPVAEDSPTCQKTGVEAHYKCTRDDCGLLFRTAEDAQKNVTVAADDLIMATVGHDYQYSYNDDATCLADGTNTVTCKFGCSYNKTETAAGTKLDHVWGEYVYDEGSATCQHDGVKRASCTLNCGTSDEVIVEGTKLDHEYTDHKVLEEATCTKAGLKEVICVNGCNGTKTETIAKLGHVYAEQEGQAATCYAEGWEKYYQCTSSERDCCGLYFANIGDSAAIDLESWKAGAGKLEKVAHDYESVVTAPTCLEKGYTTYTCKNCTEGTEGYSYVDDYKDALQHKYDTGVILEGDEPTCTVPGEKTFTCLNDCCTEQTEGHTKTEPVDPLGHNLVKIEGQASTCDAAGWNSYYQCAEQTQARTTSDRTYCGYYFANEDDAAFDAEPIATSETALNTWKTTLGENGGAIAKLEHEDTDNDHLCDQPGCDYKLTECADNDQNHNCDYTGCNDVLSECVDNDKDHFCDYTGCKKELSKCADVETDKDHLCDLCDKPFGDHVFQNGTCNCGYVQDLKVTITIVAEGQTDQKLDDETIKYLNNGQDYTKTLNLKEMYNAPCYTILNLSAKVDGEEIESDKLDNTLTIASGLLTGDVEIVVEAHQNHQTDAAHTNVTIKAPTCVDSGEKKTVITCKNCGAEYDSSTEVLLATDHDWEKSYVDPTFDADGYTQWHCKNDSSHDYKEIDEGTKLIAVARIGSTRYQTLKEAIEAAEKRDTIELLAKCVVEDTQVWDKNITMLIPAVDDNYGLVIKGDLTIKSGTFVVNGFYGIGVTGRLTIDGGTFELEEEVDNDYLIGSWGTTVINGGIFEGQYNCVNAFQGTVEIKGGNFTTADKDCTGEWDSSDVLAEGDGTAVITSGTFSKSVEDYLAEGHCQREVGGKYYVAPHSSGEAVQENIEPATCTDNGSYDLVTYCTRCDAEISRENKTIDALGHTVEVIAGKEADCLNPGYHEAYHCTVCDGYYATRDTENDKLLSGKIEDLTAWQTTGEGKIDALGHDLVHTEEVSAACETSGVKEYWQCSRCEAAFEDEEENTPIVDLATWKAEGGKGYLKKLGHAYTSEVTEHPTCEEDGVRTYTCQNDKTHTYTEVEPKLGHEYEVTYTWNAELTTCTASAVCKNDNRHKATMNAVVKLETSTPADCENEGTGNKVATFSSNQYGIENQSETVIIPALGHKYTNYVTKTEPNCTENGTEVAQCDHGCGKEDIRVVENSALGHNMDEIAAVDATCTKDGIIHHYQCKACLGRFYDEQGQQPIEQGKHIAPALKHDYQTTVTEPDCENQGYTTYTCSRGDHTYKDNFVDALGHNYEWEGGKVVTDPTCTEDGFTTYDCSRCEETHTGDVVKATGHDMKNMGGKAGTCTEVGWKVYYQCQNSCGLYYEWVSEQQEYSLVGDETALEAWKTGAGQTNAYGHNWQEVAGQTPDCDDAGYLKSYECIRSTCGLHFSEKENDKLIGDGSQAAYEAWIAEGGAGYLKPNGHTEGETKNENIKKPECDVDGSHDVVTYCAVCKNEISRETVVDSKTGHTEEKIPAIAPDCTNIGWSEGVKCSVCGETLEAATVVPATGHTPVTDPAVEATCTATGLTEGSHCGVCNEPLVIQTVVSKKAHSYTQVVETNLPSCTEDGSQVLKCATCEDRKTETLAAKGHNSDGIIEAVEPSCTKPGQTEGKKCTVCGETQVAPETIPATGHQNVTVIAQVDPDCVNNGVKEHYFCEDCKVYFATKDSETAYSDAITNLNYWKANGGKIDKLGHTNETIPAVAPTCTEDGLKSGVKCSVCGVILVAQEVDPAKGHNEVTDKAVDPTCTTDGKTEGKHCSVCTETLIKQEIIPATGHLAVTVYEQVDATCTVDGVKEHYFCDDCDKYFATKVSDTELSNEIANLITWKSGDGKINKLGHKEEDIPAVAPDCTETGLTAGKKCTVCGETTVKQDTVPALGHKEVIDGKVNPTCTETGLTEGKHCSVCGEVLVAQEIVEAKGHKGFVIKGQAAKCELDGWKDYYQCGNGCQLFFEDLECTKPIENVDTWKTGEGKVPMIGHAWDEGRVTTLPTCTEDGVKTFTCGNCNGTKTEAEPMLGHDVVPHAAQHPTYYSAGWDAYETCTRCDHNTLTPVEALGEPSVHTFEEFMTSLKILEDYANAYVKANPGKDPMLLLIKYVRTGVDRYNSGSWNIMAGYEDEGFAKYVMEQEESYNKSVPTIEDMINVTGIKNIANFNLPNGDSVDFGHMFGTMDITYHNKTSINHADVAGWAGDLVDLLSTADRHYVTGTVDEMIKIIGEQYLNHHIEGESDQFSQTDMYGDLDGFYFMNELIGDDYEPGMLYSMMEKYFVSSLTDEQRADYFLKNRLGGVTGRSEIREAVFSEYLGNSVIATLEGTREFQQTDVSDMRKACCYAFADYLCKLAGDYVELGDNPYFSVFSTELSTLAPGITQQISKATTADGKQVVYYTATADVNSPYVNVYANYKDNDPTLGWGMQRVMDQANAAQAKYGDPASDKYIPNYNVIASINGAGYNMTTGEPSGILVMGGVEYHKPNGDGFVGILKDGSAYIGTDAEYYEMMEQGLIAEAISGFGTVLVKDGKINVTANSSYFNERASRTAFGITKTGKVVFMVMDGRQEPVSCGGSMVEIAQVMLEAGCVQAINLDGGGSTTYVARKPGDEELSLISSPSDGFQRSVSTSLFMVSTAPSSTKFDKAILDSDVRHVTIGATAQLTASAVSAMGNAVDLPEGTTWAVSDSTIATISPDGVLTGVANGTVNVNLMLDGKVVGTRTMYVVIPDTVYFTKENMNAVYGEPATLPVAALFEGKPVAITEKDVTFSLSNAAAGTTEGYTFIGNEASNVKAVRINAHAVFNPDATSGSMNINLFKAGETSFDFDNAVGGDRILAWDRVVSNSTTVDEITYNIVDKEKPMVTEYSFGMDMTQIPMPEELVDLVYMLPGADVEGNNSAWDFLLQLAERVSVLTEVKAVIQIDPRFDVDFSKMTVVCEYFNLEKTELNPETNELTLSLRWKDQTKAIDPDTANPIVILSGIKLTPKEDADWGEKDQLAVVNTGNISYDIYLRANALYSFASKPENQEAFKLYPFVNKDVIIGGAPESGGHFMDTYKEFKDEYTLNKGMKNGWVYEDGGYAYYEDDVKYTGVQKVGPYYYDFGSDGINIGQTKYTGMFQIDGVNYNAKEGLLSGGWYIDKDNNKYYFDENGKAVDGEAILDEVKMIFDNGLLIGGQTGFVKKSNGNTYYYQNGNMYYGWLELGDDWYHFNTENGIMTVGDGTANTKLFPDQEAKAKGAYYVFDAEGHALYGFPNNFGYYYWAGQPMRDQWVRNGYDLDGWYHTNGNGHFVTTPDTTQQFQLTLGDKTYTAVKIAYDGVVYTFDNSNGKLLLGSMVLEDDKWFYYWAGEPVNDGWFEFNGETYYAFEDGHLATGSQVIDGKPYMFTPQGVLVTEGVVIHTSLSADNKTMTVTVRNADEAMTKARLAIWAVKAGQDATMKWCGLRKQDATTWTVEISMCQFRLQNADTFEIHAYGTIDGNESLIVNTTVNDLAPAAHTYTDDMDTTCNLCGYKREIHEEQVNIPTTPMYRLYNPNSGEHFYTGSIEERDTLVVAGWNYEGVAWNAPIYTGEPVYRVFNPISGDHHYTMSQEEIDNLVSIGWNYEGVAWNSASPNNIPQYRMYNPNAAIGSHHYTSSIEERDNLVSVGWHFEGIGWFGTLK